jgi:hypothetical protein
MIVVPANSGAILFRQIMTSDALENGILYNFGNLNVSRSVMIAIIFLSGMLFIWFSVLLMKQYKNV